MKKFLFVTALAATLLWWFLGWNWISAFALVGFMVGVTIVLYRWVILPDSAPGGGLIFMANSLDEKKNSKAIIEAASVVEQRRSGRERGNPITVVVRPDAHFSDYETHLNYQTLQKSGVDIVEDGKPQQQIDWSEAE
jgi:hypothetical protein